MQSRRVHPGYQIFLILLLVTACFNGETSRAETETAEKDAEEEINSSLLAKQVFNTLPSPFETAAVLKSAGAIYDEQLMNPSENAGGYLTTKKMALNLGIYSTSMCYSSLFRQNRTCMKYMEAARKLAGNLGLTGLADQDIFSRLEADMNEPEIIMEIIHETFMNSDAYVTKNEPVAAIMFIGSWIEGLYLALNLADSDDLENNYLVNRIAESKISLDMIMYFLKEYDYIDEISELLNGLNGIAEVFNRMVIRTSRVNIINVPDDPIATLRPETVSDIDPELFRELRRTVTETRNSFI
jgi:hypothetical protein